MGKMGNLNDMEVRIWLKKQGDSCLGLPELPSCLGGWKNWWVLIHSMGYFIIPNI